MDLYKKKNLKFSGMGAGVRAAEMNAARRSVRQQRFSLQRPLEEAEKATASSKIPRIGDSKEASRREMLLKWKEQKDLKKRLEALSKKPAFKAGKASNAAPLDALGSSRLLGLQSSRIQHYSRLADATSSKDRVQAVPTKPATSSLQKQNPTKDTYRSFSTKPATSNIQQKQNSMKEKKYFPTKPTSYNLQAKSTTVNLQQKQNSAKNVTPSQSSKPVTVNPNLKQNLTKIPMSGNSRPLTFLPQRKTLNQPSKLKPVSNTSSKTTINKEKPPEKLKEKQAMPTTQPNQDKSLVFPCQLSRIEPESSFAPPNYVFCPPKIRSSWLEDEGPCSIVSRVRQEMDGKQRTSTPKSIELKKLQELEKSSDEEFHTGESSSKNNECSPKPCSDTQSISVSTDSPAIKLPESCNMEEPFKKDFDAESSVHITDIVLTEMENLKLGAEEIPPDEKDTKHGVDFIMPNKANLKQGSEILLSRTGNLNDVAEQISTEAKIHKFVDNMTPSVKKENIPTSENNLIGDKLPHLRELSVNVFPIAKSRMDIPETIKQSKGLPKEVTGEVDEESVFFPNELVADALVEKSTRRFTRSLWRMEKPSLAQISESPENTPKVVVTPKLNRRRGIPAGFTPRRSARIALLNELKAEDNIFDVKECFLDSPSVEAASRMSMATYDFDQLHLEAKGALGKEKSEPTAPKPNNRKVSLLYTPPRSRASTRNMSIKEDLITFSPNVK